MLATRGVSQWSRRYHRPGGKRPSAIVSAVSTPHRFIITLRHPPSAVLSQKGCFKYFGAGLNKVRFVWVDSSLRGFRLRNNQPTIIDNINCILQSWAISFPCSGLLGLYELSLSLIRAYVNLSEHSDSFSFFHNSKTSGIQDGIKTLSGCWSYSDGHGFFFWSATNCWCYWDSQVSSR